MSEANPNSRLEAFCDGVFAIALTLLIIEIRIPHDIEINSVNGFWLALIHISPSLVAFALSFTIIFITWVNHHAILKLTNKTAPAFIYANGLLLLTVVFLPFPTTLLGEYTLTEFAAPAVMLYNSTLVLQALGWILLGRTVLRFKLYKNDEAAATMRQNTKFGVFAFMIYSLFVIAAIWIPIAIAIITILTWIFWLILGIKMKHY